MLDVLVRAMLLIRVPYLVYVCALYTHAMANIVVKGKNGTVSFDGSTVTVERSGFTAVSIFGKSSKRIPLNQLSAVQFKAGSLVVNGYIEFTFAGGGERQAVLGRGSSDQVRNENAVVFSKKNNVEFQQLADAINEALSGENSSTTPAGVDTTSLEKLAELHASGILSDQEFAAAKAKALGI